MTRLAGGCSIGGNPLSAHRDRTCRTSAPPSRARRSGSSSLPPGRPLFAGSFATRTITRGRCRCSRTSRPRHASQTGHPSGRSTPTPWKAEDQADEADPSKAMRGASAAAGAADYTLSLRYSNGTFGTQRRLSGKGRFVWFAPLTLDFNLEDSSYSLVGAAKDVSRETTWRLLCETGALDATPRSATEIARIAGLLVDGTRLDGATRRRILRRRARPRRRAQFAGDSTRPEGHAISPGDAVTAPLSMRGAVRRSGIVLEGQTPRASIRVTAPQAVPYRRSGRSGRSGKNRGGFQTGRLRPSHTGRSQAQWPRRWQP